MMNPRARRRILRILQIAGTLVLLTIALLLLGRQVLFQGPYARVSPLPPERIIDMHCHVAGIGAGGSGCFVSEAMRRNFRFGIYLQAFGVTDEEVRRTGDSRIVDRISEQVAQSAHVGRVVLLAMDGVMDATGHLDTNRTEIYVPDTFVAAAALRHTNLLFGASVHPHRVDALERLDWAAAHGAVLVKWIPSIMEIDPADPSIIPFYDRLHALGLPLLSHTGPERSFTRAHDELSDPERLRLALEHGVVVIAAHAGAGGEHGGESDLARLRRLMLQFPNLYADISALTQINRVGALGDVLTAPECRGRLVYGSDFPLINTALVSPWYFPLNLTERQREEVAAIVNPWDRDVRLKQFLGVPAAVFSRAASLLRFGPVSRAAAVNPRPDVQSGPAPRRGPGPVP